MSDSNVLSQLIWAKLGEQVERASHLVTLVPPDHIEWRPLPDAFRVCDLLGHLLECLAGLCATLYALEGERLGHFARLRGLTVNHCCGVEEALARIREYLAHLEEGFALINDADLARRLPTLFAPEGEAALAVLLGNLEHFNNHKYQLYFYLKMIGVPVTARDLYRF